MNFTLKIRWMRSERVDGIVGIADESTLFIAAKAVTVHRHIAPGEREQAMKSWDDNASAYFNYLCVSDFGATGGEDGGRLIQVITPDGGDVWYLATHAWLLGPTGDTIERLAP